MVGGPPSLPDEARELVEALEARWSRFRPDSEVSRLNQQAGRPVRVSPETLTLLPALGRDHRGRGQAGAGGVAGGGVDQVVAVAARPPGAPDPAAGGDRAAAQPDGGGRLPEGLRLLAATGADGLLVDERGSPHGSAGFERFTRRVREGAG